MNINISDKGRKSMMRYASSLCLAVTVSAAMAAPPATIAGTYGTLTIGDLPGTIDRIGSLANKINPGFSGDSIKSLLGMQLGDAGLASVPAGSGLMAVMTKAGKPFFLLETAAGKAETLSEAIKQRGPQVAVINDKLLAVAMDEAALNEAKGAAGTAAAAELAKSDDKFLLLTLDADALIADKGDSLKAALNNVSKKIAESGEAKTSAPGSMFKILGNAVVAVGKRTDVSTIKIDISSDGIEFEKTLYPVGGVTVAKAEGPTGQELLKSIPGSNNALAKYEAFMDTQSSIKVIGDIMTESLDGSDVSAADKEAVKSLLNTAAEGFGDGIGGWMALNEAGNSGIYAVSVINKDKALQYMEDGIKQMNDGALGKMYTAMGIDTSATLVKNAGTVDGQPYHSFSVSMGGEAMDNAPAMFKDIKDAKVTFVGDNKMVLTMGDSSLEEAVAAVKSGNAPTATSLKSRAGLPANAAFYADYNAGALGTLLKSQNAQVGEVMDNLKGTPILEAFYVNEDNLKFTMLIPGELITNAISGFQKMATQQQPSDDSEDSDDDSSTAPAQSNE